LRKLVWGARLLLAVFFLLTGAVKLLALPNAVAAFERLGVGQGFRIFIGVCEIAGALGLLVTPLAALAATGLGLIMAGAVPTELFVLADHPVQPVVPLVAGLVCLFVAVMEWRTRGGRRE